MNKTLDKFHIILYNDDTHTFDEVIRALVDICGCSTETAAMITQIVHVIGKVSIGTAHLELAETIQSHLQDLGLKVELVKQHPDSEETKRRE